MAEQNKRTYDGVYNSLKQISDEEGVDFGLDGMSQEDFRKKYFTGPGNIENLYHRLNKISNEEGIDFGQGSRDEWLSSFGYRRNADGQKGYQTLDGRPVGRRKAPKPQQTPAGGAVKPSPKSSKQEAKDSVNAENGYIFTEAGLDSAFNKGYPVRAVAGAVTPQKGKRPDASSYGIPYRPDIELTAAQRDEIEQQNGYAAKQVKQMRQQSEKNQRRRNQPVIDTGDENVNRHIIKTQGQWEDELMNGVNDLGRKYVSPMIEKALKKADNDFFGVFEQASRYPQMQGMELAALRRANERVDPDKILQGLQKSLEKTYSNPEMLKDIEERANAAGIPKDEYLKQVVIPSLQDQLVNEFTNSQIAKHMPKNATEYILQGMSNSIGGMLMGAATETEAQRRYKNEAAAMTEEGLNPHYTPGTGAKLAQMGVSFAADAPFFGFYGKVGGNVAKGLAERQIRKLTAKGLSEGAARSIVGTALENSVGQRMKNYIMQHVVSSSITMGGYNATSETARQVRDREFKPGQIIGSTAEGLATGAAFGLTGGAVQALSQPLSGIARIGSKVGGYLVEGETMYTTEELAKMVHGEEGFTNPFEGSAEAMMKLGVMKVSSPGGLSKAAGELFHPIKSNRRQQTGVRFTPEEEAYVRESAEGKSLLDALSQMHPEMATTEVKGKRQLTAEGEQMRQQLAERYNAFMSNTEIPYAVKAKVAGALGGLMPDAAHTPLETGADIIHNADGSVILKTRDKDGNCMQELRFDSFSEADNWREQHEGDFRLNDAVNMWNGASPEARANTIRQLMEEYGVGEEEAVAMVKSALGGSMGTDFSNDQFLYIYDAVRNNAYPADEPNTRRNYWEGQKLTPQERHQAMVDAQQAEDRLAEMDQAFAEEVIGAADYPDEKIAELAGREEITGEQLQAAIDYYNKAARFNGMMEKAAQSVDDQVEAANAFVQRNTHKESGSMVEVESDGRGYYLTAGKIELNPDGSLNMQGCGDVMILRDKETGEIQVASPRQIKVTALNDPQRMIAENESMDGLRGQLMQETNNSITLAEGTPEAPQNGDYFTGADGIRYMAIGVPDEQGNVVWSKIALDEKGEPVGEPMDLDIDEYRKAKSDEIDRESQIIPEEEIVSDVPETVNHEGEIIPEETAEQPLPQQEENTPVVEEATVPDAEKGSSSSQTAFPRIPVVNGKTDWESASTEDSRAALTERYGEEKAREMVGRMITNLQQSYDELLKKDVSKMTDMDKIAAYEDELADIKRKMDYWRQVFEENPAEEVMPEEQPKVEPPVSEQPESVPNLTESVPKEPESVPAEPPAVTPQEPAPAAPEKPAEPQPAVQPPVQPQPQQPTAEQKIAEGSVKANLGKTFEFLHNDGRRTEMRLESISPGGRAVVTQTDYDAQGNRIGEPQRKVYNVTDIGGSIIQGAMKPVLSTEEKLRAAYKGRVGILNVIDVLTDSEQEQMLRAYENGDNEALTALMHEFTETHREDIILNERDKRNANVSQIMEGNSSREDKLRRVRKQYQGYDDAVLALSDEAMQPTTLEEYVADLHSRQPKSGEGPIAYFSYDRDGTKVVGLQDETGYGSKTGGDTKGYAPWLAPKGKGVSLAKYAEQLHEQLPEGIKAQYSDQDVRNAILEVFGGAERPSDITTMVIKRGIIQAEQAARRMEEMWIEGGPSFHRVSIDDNTFAGRLARGKQQTNTEPTEKQKEAGNYKKGHVSFGGYDFVIENPEGSMRRGKDADGKKWEQQMHNTYGYILGKRGKDGDHLDMFINDNADLDNWSGKVYVVDQVNPDGTFDESKILYGFDSEAEAREAYLSNYQEGWQGLGRITGVDKTTFDKWLDSSTRQMKPFAEHSIIKSLTPAPSTRGEGSSQSAPAERDKVLMDAVVDKMREARIDVSTDWEEGQRVLDEYNGSHELKPMGQKTNKKKAQVAADLEGKELTPEQQAVVDVYTGKKNNAIVEFTRNGKKNRIAMRKGNERFAGTEHSLYGHYGTSEGVISSEDILRIPEILSNGEKTPVKVKNKQRYEYTFKADDGTEFTVVTERNNHGREEFTDFYSNKKGEISRSSTPSEEARASDTDNALSGAKVQQNPETTKESDEKLKQFKTSDGHAYGFTYKGKIYIDPRIATSETPIHEYGHLWAEMKRQTAPEEWDAIKNVLLNDKLVKPIIDRVKKDYPELAKEGREDDFIEEILTQFSGKRGAERLREIAEQIAAEKGGVFGKAEAVTAMQRLRNVLVKFWADVAKMMGWKYSNANEIADKMMLDFLEGMNPTEKVKEISKNIKDMKENAAARDKEYAEAVAAGDMEKVDAMLREEARRKGYSEDSSYQGSLAFNGAAPSKNGYFETREERKQAMEDGTFEDTFSLGDYAEAGIDANDLEWQLANPLNASAGDKATLSSIRNINNALKSKSGKIKMYRAVDAAVKEDSFRNGDWVTPSREYAEQHIGLQDWKKGRIIEQEVPIDDIWWNGDDINEWGYDDGKDYAYKNTKNNRKLMEPTYDENGNLIPLSERFNDKKDDILFQKVPERKPYNLSETKKDAEGNRMYEREGSIDLWTATPLLAKARRQQAPIRLSERNMNHIIFRHSDKLDTEDKVFDFLDNVFANAKILRRAKGRGMFVVVESENTDRAAIIKLMPSEDGDYYNIDSAGFYRKDKWKESEEVIADLSEPSQSDAVSDASKPQAPNDNGREPINAETQNSSSDGKVTDNIREKQEKSEKSAIQGLENYSEKDVTDLVGQHFDDLVGDSGVEIVDMKVIGSRANGKAKDDSDLDVLLEYKGDMSEDALFNILNDEDSKLYIEGIPVDINPITKGKSGTIDQWMKRNGEYDKESEDDSLNFREGEAQQVELSAGQRKLTPRQMRERQAYAERQWRRAHEWADDTVKKLKIGDKVTIVDSIEELKDYKKFSARKKNAKGWYDPETDSIVIVMGNHRSPTDVVKTILHEAVAHHGLRKLFGGNYDTFLDNAYKSATFEIRDSIDELANKYDGDVRKATEEYMGKLAEDTEFENAENRPWVHHWFNQIKRAFLDMLKTLGLKDYKGVVGDISDNELRYILWRSYKNLTEPDAYRNVFQQVEDIAMRNKLAKEVKMPVKGRIEDEIPQMLRNHNDEIAIQKRVSQMSLQEAQEAYKRLDDMMRDEQGRDLDEQFEAHKLEYREKNGLNGIGKFVADDLKAAMDKYGSGMIELRWELADRIEQLGGSLAAGDGKELYRDGEEEGPRFQRVSNPEPELTPEDKQYWKQWDAAMKKWKERNAIAADVTGPGEQPKINQGESVLDYAKRLVAHKRESALWQTAPKLEDFHQVRDDKAAQDEAHANEKAYPDSESAKRWRVATDLARLRHAMSRQKAYDKATVKAVTDFAQDFMKMGFGDNLGRGEMERLLSSVKNATGAKDIRKQVDNIMNILIDNQLRNLDQQVVKLSSVKELSKTAQGVEKQGRLELKGQRMIQAFRQAREGRMDAEKIRERLGEVAEKMSRNDEEAPMWEQEYEGLSIALQYQENIEGSRDEWADLDREYKDAMKEYKQSGRSYKAQQELLESLEQAMMENKIERIGMFGDIIGRLQGNISESMQGAKEFVEREKERMKHIQQIANFDLAGKDMGAMREKIKGKPANFFLQPLATFEQMLRQFGSRNASGEGYLFDHFMRSWMDSTDKAYVNEQKAKEELDAKAREVFGDKVKRWSDLYEIVRSLPTLEVEVLDGEDPKTFTLNQGNLLYIYMADKMTDGRMKLRKMGIDEETVEKVKDFLDPRLVQLGDWLQDDYLVQKRIIYNKVHERMFGAPMAAIDHYFPLKILGDARYQEQDVSNMADQDAVLPSTITGNIIKRRKNALPLDILHTDALSLAIEHVEDMERWAATAEWNKDINTLLSYTTFRNKVKNMSTIYGSGDALWNTFADTARMAAGTYRPKAKPGSVDSAISNIAKGVTAAKINFRVYTAFKQILSAPAFLHDVNIGNFVKNSVNPYGSWKWAMENMPVFRKRWKSRQVGDTRLMDDPTDWKMWKTNLVQKATRMGMSPNALVDGVTCAVGARAIYQSRYKKYKSIGASDEVAHKRALQDAEIGYNLTQQSSEGAFVSAIQKDRTVAANMLSVFRNSSMAYTRQWVDAARNLKHRSQKGYKEDAIGFMTRQLQEQFGIDEAHAKKAAEAEYARAGRHDVARMLNMMFGVTVAWNLGASLPYLLIGDDDETKSEMMTDALLRGLAAGPTEGFAAGNLFSEFISRSFASEQTRKAFRNEGWGSAIDSALKQGDDYEVNPLPLMADIQGMIKKMGYDKFAAAQDVFNICAQSAVGVNPQTFTDMWNACMDYGAPGWDGTSYTWEPENMLHAKELALFMMRLMNAPTSSWRNKYIDELGMNAKDAQKLSYEEMARRYAHYKHWKDAPIMGWLRGEEGREEKIGKIRKQFDKSVQERIDRLDDEELRHNLLRSKSLEERRLLAKGVASRFGLAAGEDAKNAKKQWQQNYQQLMEYEDIREDALLSAKKKEANARGDHKTVKAINDLQSRIREKGKKKLGGDDDAELMQKIRQWRREALEKAIQAESR